jgi:hypothetical protein
MKCAAFIWRDSAVLRAAPLQRMEKASRAERAGALRALQLSSVDP